MARTRLRRLGLIAGTALLANALVAGQADGLPPGTAKTGLVCTPPSTTTGDFDLVADAGAILTPDGNSVHMWSYSVDRTAPGSSQAFPLFQYPGPVLCANQGDTVTVNLRNELDEPVSIVFPGQDLEVTASGGSPGLFTAEAAANGGTVSYSFVANEPGTYRYESGSDIAKQVEMGLVGALVVRPASGANRAYDPASTQYAPGKEFLLLLSEVDTNLHHLVEIDDPNQAYDFTTKRNRYFFVNGRAFPDTLQDNGSSLLPNQPYGSLVRVQPNGPGNALPSLIRMINAGVDSHPFHPHGNHLTEIAQDGRLLVGGNGGSAATERFGESIGAGQTRDFLLRWDTSGTDTSGAPFDDAWDPSGNPLPVPQPNYRNLTFKDGTTWYSGSPYLGYKGTLPTGTASYNLCGEWYFPWHSHALNEFVNFDEPMGGMATLLRVDPSGGCFAVPTSTKVSLGSGAGGTYTALAADDGSYYRVSSTTTGTRTTDWYGQFSGVASGSTGLKASYTGNTTFLATTQSFNGLAQSGTSGVLPTGWTLSETGTGSNTTYTADNGNGTAGNTYSYGIASSNDRAFGTLRGSGAVVSTIGASFTNTTGGPITSLSIGYIGELWRYGGGTGAADRLDFQYSTDATSLTTGTWLDPAGNALDFSSMGTGSAGARSGNSPANRAAISGSITGLSIPVGGTIWVRWADVDRPATADDGLAIEDVSITPDAQEPTTVYAWNWAGAGSWVQVGGTTGVGATDVAVVANASMPSYVGTGANKGLVRLRVLTSGGTNGFVTGGDLMKLVYNAP